LIGEGNFLKVSLGLGILILNPIGKKNHSHWFMKDEEAIDWRKRFPTFHWTRRTSSRRGDRKLTKRNDIMCVFFGRRRRRRRMSV
jgi:hypothetical protein